MRGHADPVSGSFLASLDARERSELEQLGVVREYPRGSMLMLQGEPEDRVVVLLSGRVKVARADRTGRELMLDIGDPGEALGELAFIDGQPRIATVTALEPVAALVVGSETFHAYLARSPHVAAALTEMMSHYGDGDRPAGRLRAGLHRPIHARDACAPAAARRANRSRG